tara:strand:+ start:368 stop:808 length:441 start_codon:yes stop_codon:yes gene_type:complete
MQSNLIINKQVLIGMLLVKSKYHLEVIRSNNSKVGYTVRPTIKIRGDYKLLKSISRSMYVNNIGSEHRLILEENSTRPLPIIEIRGIKRNLSYIDSLLPQPSVVLFPKLEQHISALEMLVAKQHLTLKGIEILMKMRGILDGTNDD